MNRKALVIIALQAGIIVILFWMLVFYGKDEFHAGRDGDDEEIIRSASLVSTEHGTVTITLTPQAQEQSGITTSPVTAAAHRREIVAHGKVLAIDGLIELRRHYLAALAEAGIVHAGLPARRQEYERLARLNREDRNVSDRAVEAALATLREDEARLAAAKTAAANWLEAIRQQWGATIAEWAARQPPAATVASLLQHKEVLLQITLPFDIPPPDGNVPLAVMPAGAGTGRIVARLVAAAPLSEDMLQGRTYYYRAPADHLRIGMRVSARLPAQHEPVSGILIPDAAIVWFANQSWVYHKVAADKFVRRPVNTDIETPEGWFNPAGVLPPDAEIVTRGAQLLLSEEFKHQIPNENED